MDRRGNNNYSLNSNKPAFCMLDDDDMASEFLSTPGATYLAADRLGSTNENQQPVDEAEVRRQEILRQMRQIEQRTTQSSRNCLSVLDESEKVGVETAEALIRQREQLENTDRRLDDIHGNLKDTQKDINGIKSVFSSLRNWWSAPKKDASSTTTTPTSPTSPKGGVAESGAGGGDAPNLQAANPNLSSAYQKSSQSVASSMKAPHPSLHLKGLEELDEEDQFPDSYKEFRQQSRKVDQQLDSDLDQMCVGLSRLKGLAIGLGSEIEDQNEMVDRITGKADRAGLTIGSQNTQMKKLLGKK